MGHWSETCGVTHLPIQSEDKIGMLFLTKHTYEFLNDGCLLNYNVMFLPVFGTYDDYGGIKNIEINAHTKAIETYFKTPIQDICNMVTSRKSKHDVFKDIHYMYFRKEIYDKFNELHGSNLDEFTNIAYYASFLIINAIEDLGFKYKKTLKDNKRYKHIYTNDLLKDVELRSDGVFSIELYINGKNIPHVFSICDLEKSLIKNGFDINYSSFKQKQYFKYKLKNIKKDIEKYDKKDVLYILKNAGETRIPFSTSFALKYADHPIIKIYKNEFINGKIDEEVIGYVNFYRRCLSMGVHFRPILPTGAQDGWYETIKLVIDVLSTEYNKYKNDREN